MIILLIFLSFLVAGCSQNIGEESDAAVMQRLKEYTETISCDEFAGRKPFTEGADKAVEYIAAQMKEVGLVPFDGDSYLQQVKLVSSDVNCSDMKLVTGGRTTRLHWLEEFTAFNYRSDKYISLQDVEMVFAGYGIVAPEYGKNDFAGIENPQNKIAVVIVNDPGLDNPDQTIFNGDVMTYYGRWTYKFEEGARQGLKGVLIIHEDKGAGYGWSVVTAGARSKMYLDEERGYQCPLNGWLRNDIARTLLADNGYNLDQLKEMARRSDFTPVELKTRLSLEISNSFTRNSSPNVIGYLPGSGETDESIVYLGHWDHLGVAKPTDGDSIINGATDNAVAVAWMLEIARKFASNGQKPRRNVVFLSPTCEEPGLFGAEYYVAHPLFPVEKVAAVINFDVFPLWGENFDVTITGYGNSDLDSTLALCAAKQGRYIMADPDASNGMFYRSDHLPFMKRGVPAMFAKGWNDNKIHGKEWSTEHIADYWANTYHKITDQVNPEEDDYSGLLQEVKLFYDFGLELANSAKWPQWRPDSEFASVADRP